MNENWNGNMCGHYVSGPGRTVINPSALSLLSHFNELHVASRTSSTQYKIFLKMLRGYLEVVYSYYQFNIYISLCDMCESPSRWYYQLNGIHWNHANQWKHISKLKWIWRLVRDGSSVYEHECYYQWLKIFYYLWLIHATVDICNTNNFKLRSGLYFSQMRLIQSCAQSW